MTLDSANDFSAKGGKVRLIVRSKYTYGKFVKGEAIVSLTPSYHGIWIPYPRSDIFDRGAVIKTIKIDGKGVAEFDIEKDLNLEFDNYQSSRSYSVRSVVVEELTGRNETATKQITIHKTKYKFTTINNQNDFRGGLPVEFSVFPSKKSH